jgi:hypothetical protein
MLDFLQDLSGRHFQAIVCASLLEYLPNRQKVCKLLSEMLPIGGLLFVSSPYRYPQLQSYDPKFRPTPNELSELFPHTLVTSAAILHCRVSLHDRRQQLNYYIPKPMNQRLKWVFRMLLPFYKPQQWRDNVEGLLWIFRTYKISCLMLVKQPEGSSCKK